MAESAREKVNREYVNMFKEKYQQTGDSSIIFDFILELFNRIDEVLDLVKNEFIRIGSRLPPSQVPTVKK